MTKFDAFKAQMIHSKRAKPIQNKNRKFSQQHIHLSDIALLPQGYETLFLALYFVFLPYLAGLLFQFCYISAMKVDVFLSVYEQSFFMFIWAMGYELIAFTLLLIIFKMSLTFSKDDLKPNMQKFRIP
ncbi:MAG: hypothetical protein GQ531_05855 [Sulfurovum sp.]|nr:hypothetical protein [Sulfurovum sp.]